MLKVMTSADFILSVKNLDERLKNIKLNSVEINREDKSVCYNFICDVAVDEKLRQDILEVVEKQTAEIFSSVEIKVAKIASDTELINNAIFKYLNDNYPSVSIFLKRTDIISVDVGGVIKYTLRLTKDGGEYIQKNGAIKKLNEYLSKNFCSEFAGNTDVKEDEEIIDLKDDDVYESELQKIEQRTIKVSGVEIIDGIEVGDTALYIEDAKSGVATICGTITDIAEKMTKSQTPKPFFIIHLDDTTGRISGVYFTRKSTYPKIKTLQVGDTIIARGTFGDYNGKQTFTYDKINKCTFPADFVKKERYKKVAPKNYTLIYPEETTTVKVNSVFDGESVLPQELVENDYVVFDLETTGIDYMSNGITEIGAVKIHNGKISEQWTTLVKPDYPITEENFKITGISEEMVKTAPKISAVLPDFMKFIEGTVLVAHNAEFDTKFIKRFASGEEYEIKNKIMDTLILSRQYLPHLKHFNLNTVADNFNIVFHHHRAMSDAYATAEIFIELMKIKNKKG